MSETRWGLIVGLLGITASIGSTLAPAEWRPALFVVAVVTMAVAAGLLLHGWAWPQARALGKGMPPPFWRLTYKGFEVKKLVDNGLASGKHTLSLTIEPDEPLPQPLAMWVWCSIRPSWVHADLMPDKRRPGNNREQLNAEIFGRKVKVFAKWPQLKPPGIMSLSIISDEENAVSKVRRLTAR